MENDLQVQPKQDSKLTTSTPGNTMTPMQPTLNSTPVPQSTNQIQQENQRDPRNIENEEDICALFTSRKDSMHKHLEEHKTKLSEKYSHRINKIVKQFKSINETYIKEFPESYTDLMDEIRKKAIRNLQVEEILLRGILLNLQNYENYIDSVDFETTNDNTGFFVGNALLNESLFNEDHDFASFDYDNNHLVTKLMYDTIIQKLGANNISYSVTEESLKDKDIRFISENCQVLSSLEFNGIKKTENEYFIPNNSKIIFDKLDSITYKDCLFNGVSGINDSTKNAFTALKTLIYNNSLPANTENIIQFPPFTICNSLSSLINLKFEKANIVNSEFVKIMTSIIKNEPLRRQLKTLSFADNQLTSVDFKKRFALSSVKQFDSMEEMNFSQNRIYTFKISYVNAVKHLKLVNLIDNHFSSLTEIDQPKDTDGILFLCNRNLFLTSEANLIKYITFLNKLLPTYRYKKLQFISFSGLFNRFNSKDLLTININQDVCGSLIELDLSYCGLNTEIVISYFANNKKLVKLKTLNLKANFIEMDFFQQYIEHYEQTKDSKCLVYLEDLNLSNNSIKDEDFDYAYKFILLQRNLKHLNLQMNSFGKEYHAEKKEEKSLAKDNQKEPSALKGEEKQVNPEKINMTFYKPVDIVIDPSKKVNFIDFIRLIYYPDKPFRKFYLDFSTESRLLVASQLEKKNYYYNIKYKSKLDKHDK